MVLDDLAEVVVDLQEVQSTAAPDVDFLAPTGEVDAVRAVQTERVDSVSSTAPGCRPCQR